MKTFVVKVTEYTCMHPTVSLVASGSLVRAEVYVLTLIRAHMRAVPYGARRSMVHRDEPGCVRKYEVCCTHDDHPPHASLVAEIREHVNIQCTVAADESARESLIAEIITLGAGK